MPAISPRKLVQAILDAFHASRFSAGLVTNFRDHPRKFIVSTRDEEHFSVWIYAWTLTPGGRPTLPNEYRIQMTTVDSPLHLNPSGFTVLVGYEPNLAVFAGFDLERHGRFTAGSPSVQIDIRTIRLALQDGFSFNRKSNEELAVGIRPDQFMTYVLNAEQLHKYGKQAATSRLLANASALKPIEDDDLESLTQERQRLVQTVSRLSRLANFREQVRNAYARRCAVTRIQLRLIDAAHILPVGVPGSVDDIRNGIALSPTFHRAYDQGLIYLDEKYVMRINLRRKLILCR